MERSRRSRLPWGIVLLIVALSLNMLGATRERIRVGNLLPAILIPCAYLPIAEWLGRLF